MNKFPRRTLPLLVLAGSALSASPALASTVEVVEGNNRMEALYVAGPGEKNDVLVINLSDYSLRIKDPNANITAGDGCKSVDSHTADCEIANKSAYLYTARVLAGDGDDSVKSSEQPAPGLAGTLTYPQIVVDGGVGSDTLTGGAKGDELNGGGGGRDTLVGGDNNDKLTDGDSEGLGIDSDDLDGGDDQDEVSYAIREAPVKVNLGIVSPQGQAGENDVVRNVEWAVGGSGDDGLNGGSGENWLEGGPGNDRIVGGPGDDILSGDSGEDQVYGGSGNDGLRGDDGNDSLVAGSGSDSVNGGSGRDGLSCGTSPDTVLNPELFDFVDRGCENASFSYGPDDSTTLATSANPIGATSRTLTWSVGCPHPELLGGECEAAYGKLKLRDTRGRLIGSGTLTKKAGRRSARTEKPARVHVVLTRHGRRVLARRNGARARVSLAGHALPNARWTVQLPRVR